MGLVRLFITVFGVYAILYCLHAVKISLLYRDVQLMRSNKFEKYVIKLNKLYLNLVSKSDEEPKQNLSIQSTLSEIRRLKKNEKFQRR